MNRFYNHPNLRLKFLSSSMDEGSLSDFQRKHSHKVLGGLLGTFAEFVSLMYR